MNRNSLAFTLAAFLTCFFVFFLVFKTPILQSSSFLLFSDTAKYADIARNIISDRGFGASFIFWPGLEQGTLDGGLFKTSVLPVHVLVIALFFKLFGVGDFSIISVSLVFYLLSSLVLFFLARRFFGNLVGILSTLAFTATPEILNYAISGGTELTFIFEILVALLLFANRSRLTNVLGALTLIVMYFTRPQAFIYMLGIVLFWLIKNFEIRKALKYFAVILVAGLTLDIFVLAALDGKYFLYSILGRGSFSATSLGAGQASSDILRGATLEFGIVDLGKKIFFNLYNFYRLAPQIINPYLLTFFVVSLFKTEKVEEILAFKVSTVFIVILTVLVTAVSIPLFRYIHPVIPLIYIISIENIVWVVKNVAKKWSKQPAIWKLVSSVSFGLVFIFVVGQALGFIFLDSRFERKTKNLGRPPVYAAMSETLKEVTQSEDVVLTNLDTWGSWYGERKTVWFPLEPEQIGQYEDKDTTIDTIYLTNYLIDDPNYYMSLRWRQILEEPTDIKDEYIKESFELVGEYNFLPEDNYEKLEGRAILLTKKKI